MAVNKQQKKLKKMFQKHRRSKSVLEKVNEESEEDEDEDEFPVEVEMEKTESESKENDDLKCKDEIIKQLALSNTSLLELIKAKDREIELLKKPKVDEEKLVPIDVGQILKKSSQYFYKNNYQSKNVPMSNTVKRKSESVVGHKKENYNQDYGFMSKVRKSVGVKSNNIKPKVISDVLRKNKSSFAGSDLCPTTKNKSFAWKLSSVR